MSAHAQKSRQNRSNKSHVKHFTFHTWLNVRCDIHTLCAAFSAINRLGYGRSSRVILVSFQLKISKIANGVQFPFLVSCCHFLSRSPSDNQIYTKKIPPFATPNNNHGTRRYKNQDEDLLPNADTFTLSPHRIKCHHPNCPKMNQNSPAYDAAKCLKSHQRPANDANSIGLAASQLSSPDMSDPYDMRQASTGATNAPNAFGQANGDQQQRAGHQEQQRLRIPSAIKVEQQSVSVLFIVGQSVSVCGWPRIIVIGCLPPPPSAQCVIVVITMESADPFRPMPAKLTLIFFFNTFCYMRFI